MTTIGKTVCIQGEAAVATDIGPATVNGRPDESVRQMRHDTGATTILLARVVHELPAVTRRATFDWRPA